jgi:MFS family permease
VLMLTFLLRETRGTPHEVAAAATGSVPSAAPMRVPGLRGALGAVALFSLANASDAFLLLQAHHAGVAASMLPLLWAAHHVIKSAFSTRAGALSDRIDRRHLLVAGWLSYAVIYVLFPFATTLPAFVILFVAYAIPFTLSEGAERAWIADLVPREIRGKSFGLYYLASGVCVLLGTALFGVIYQYVSTRAAFFTAAGLAVAAVLAVLSTKRPQHLTAT